MEGYKFDPRKLEHLNNPERLKDIPPWYIWQKLEADSSDTVIDLGAGTGFYSKQFAGMADVDKVYALDISEEMIAYMNQEVAPGNPSVIPLKMDESAIPLQGNLADIVVMINLHHEFHDPMALLGECRRVLKPAGKVAIVDWKKAHTDHGPPVKKRYQAEQIAGQLKKASFEAIEIYQELPSHYLVVAKNSS